MIDLKPPFRQATPDDAAAMAELVNMAGEGLPLYLWSRMPGGADSPWEIGRQRARREEGSFSYRNAVVCEVEARAAACLIGYALPDKPEPIDREQMPAMFVPLQELENEAPGTWYVNVLATYPEYRNRGLGGGLLSQADAIAQETGRKGLSIIVSDANDGARRLYERCGYRELDRRPMVKDDWENPGKAWVLLTKAI